MKKNVILVVLVVFLLCSASVHVIDFIQAPKFSVVNQVKAKLVTHIVEKQVKNHYHNNGWKSFRWEYAEPFEKWGCIINVSQYTGSNFSLQKGRTNEIGVVIGIYSNRELESSGIIFAKMVKLKEYDYPNHCYPKYY